MKKYIGVLVLAVLMIGIMILALTNIIEQTMGMCIAIGFIVIFNIIVALYAFKNDVKLIAYLMTTLGILGIILLGFNIAAYLKLNNSNDFKFQVTLQNYESPKTFLFNYGGYDYYTYNVNDINIILKEDKKTYKLDDALKNNIITLEEILSLAAPNSDTIGYKIYYDGGQSKYNNDQYSIIICEKEKKEVIFSTFNYMYNESICK